MKIKLSVIVDSMESLQRILDDKFPAKISYQLQKNFRVLKSEFNEYEKQRSRLIVEKYGYQEMDSEGAGTGSWKVPKEKMNDFGNELSEMAEMEVDVNINKVKLPEDYFIKPSDTYLLSYMLDYDEEEAKEVKPELKKEEI